MILYDVYLFTEKFCALLVSGCPESRVAEWIERMKDKHKHHMGNGAIIQAFTPVACK